MALSGGASAHRSHGFGQHHACDRRQPYPRICAVLLSHDCDTLAAPPLSAGSSAASDSFPAPPRCMGPHRAPPPPWCYSARPTARTRGWWPSCSTRECFSSLWAPPSSLVSGRAVHGRPRPGAPWLMPVHWGNLGTVVLLAAVGQQAARLLRLPAWALLGPMLLLSALHAGGWLAIDLPRWLLAAAYALLGWHIGLSFRRDFLRHAGRALPVVVGAALCLMGLCGLLAWCSDSPGARRCPHRLPRHQPRRPRLRGDHRRLDTAGGSAVRARLAIGAAAVRDRLGAADHATRGAVSPHLQNVPIMRSVR